MQPSYRSVVPVHQRTFWACFLGRVLCSMDAQTLRGARSLCAIGHRSMLQPT